jgi:hypothetical protein
MRDNIIAANNKVLLANSNTVRTPDRLSTSNAGRNGHPGVGYQLRLEPVLERYGDRTAALCRSGGLL